MDLRRGAADTLATVAGGLAGTRLMDPVTTRLLERQSPEDRRREQRVSKGGSAPQVAVRKAADLVGRELDERQTARAANLLRVLTGVSAGPLYLWLRRSRGLRPVSAGLTAGMALFVVVDELANPLFGMSGPARAYPAATHLRGFVGHAVFGLGLAAAAEAVLMFTGRRPATA